MTITEEIKQHYKVTEGEDMSDEAIAHIEFAEKILRRIISEEIKNEKPNTTKES